MFQALSKLFFKKHWSRHRKPYGELNDREMEYYLRTSARVNKHLPKNIQAKKAAEMAAEDHSRLGWPF